MLELQGGLVALHVDSYPAESHKCDSVGFFALKGVCMFMTPVEECNNKKNGVEGYEKS